MSKSLKIFQLFLYFFFFSRFGITQLKSINFFGDYSSILSKRISVTKANSFGAGVEIKFKFSDNISIGFIGGYQLFTIEQDNALNNWNWEFWNLRYKGITQSDLTDTNLRATFTPVQKMDLLPLIITFNYNFYANKDFYFSSSLGSGILFYTRRMYLEEYWEKKFNQIGYVFSYSYRNFAPNKYGNPLAIFAGINAGYYLNGNFIIFADAGFLQIIKTNNKFGYDEFPFNNSLSFKVGLSFLY